MYVFDKWKMISLQLVESNLISFEYFPKGYLHFIEAFAIDERDLPLLCMLEVKGFLSYSDLEVNYPTLTEESWIKSITKLIWLGWIIPSIAHLEDKTYSASSQYHHRLQLWKDTEWQESETGLQLGYPSKEDMLFPMKKEVYERKLEKLSDDLQGEQLNYFEGSLFEDELDEEDVQLLVKQKDFIHKLLQSYQAWCDYIPKYYRE